MKTELITIKEAIISNNCPECYCQGSLVLYFKQKKTYSKFSTKIRKDIIPEMHCNSCGSQIYPGQWNDAILQVMDYHRKTITPIPSSTKFTKWFYLLIAGATLPVIGAVTYLLL